MIFDSQPIFTFHYFYLTLLSRHVLHFSKSSQRKLLHLGTSMVVHYLSQINL